MQNSAVRLKAIKTGGNSMNPTPAMNLNLLSGAISSLVTFSRSTVATVTDFEGVIRNTKINEARFDGMRRVENLLTYSQDFNNAAWTKPSVTLIPNSTTAPDGTITATTMTSIAGTSSFYIYPATNTISIGVLVTLSGYFKANTNNYVQVSSLNAPTTGYANFDLNLGVLGSVGAGTTASITSMSNGWYRCAITFTTTDASNARITPFIVNSNSATRALGFTAVGTESIYIWGAQVESVTGQTNQNPSEYISTNVLSYPYQGAGVDGVQYFPYTNPNCVINGVITQIPTTPINSSNSKWAYNCTASGDYFSTPSSTANRITGNLSLLAQVALDDWTPGTVQTLVAKDGVSAGTRSWAFNVQTSGTPRLNYSLDGTNILSATATVATGFTDRTVHYVGVQREASTGIVKFYTSEDGRTYTQLGSDVAGTAGALYDATTQPVQFGNLSGLSFALDGKIYDSHVYSGLKFTGTSTMVMDFDPSNWTTGTTFTGLETGEVWTLNGNAKIYQGLWDAVGPSSLLIEESRTNVFLNSTAPTTQSYTTSAIPYTISFYGSGTITLSGSYVATVAGSNPYTRTTLTFTPTAASLTMTVTGTITYPQLEAGSFATSAIVTAGSQVTRNADQASMTGTNFSSWYNQSQGTMYVEATNIFDNAYSTFVTIDNGIGLSGNALMLQGNNLNTTTTAYIALTGILTSISIALPFNSSLTKSALSAVTNNMFAASNGTISTILTGYAIPSSLTRLTIGLESNYGNYLNGHIRKLSYYATALPSAVLQALTS